MALICQCANVADVDRLLALANGAALHKALVAQGVGVSYRNVARWVGPKRKQPPADLVEPILGAFGLGHEETPPEPAWLEGLVREVRMNRAVIQAAMAGADPAFVQRVLDRLAALESRPTLSGGEAPDPIDAAT